MREEKLSKLIEVAVHESLGIETMQQVLDYARKKQVQIVLSGEKTASDARKVFKETQIRLDLVKQLRDMWSIVTILEENAIESSSIVLDGMTLKELAEQVYDELMAHAQSTTSLDSIKPVS